MDEVRLIAIDDAGARIDIPGYGTVRGPVKRINIPLSSVARLFNMYGGPRFIYFIDPQNVESRVRVSAENILWSIDKLFGREKDVEVVKEPVKVAEPIVEEVPAEETFTLEDVKEPEIVAEVPAAPVEEKVEEAKVEVEEVVVEQFKAEEPKVEEEEAVVEQLAPVEEVKEVVKETTTTSTTQKTYNYNRSNNGNYNSNNYKKKHH